MHVLLMGEQEVSASLLICIAYVAFFINNNDLNSLVLGYYCLHLFLLTKYGEGS